MEACWNDCKCVAYTTGTTGCVYWKGQNLEFVQSVASTSERKYFLETTRKGNKKSLLIILTVVNKGVEASLIQLLRTGLMFLDFGLICRMEKKHQFAMLSSIVHIVNGDWASLVHDLTEMDVARPGTNRVRITSMLVNYVLNSLWCVSMLYNSEQLLTFDLSDKLEKTESAARAQRVGSQPNFHFGSLHTAVQWAEEEPEIDPQEHAKIKIAFVRNLPSNAEENYLKQFFELFGKVEKVVVSKKASSAVGFVNFSERSLYKGFTSVSDSLLHDLEHRQNSWGEKLYAYAQQQREFLPSPFVTLEKLMINSLIKLRELNYWREKQGRLTSGLLWLFSLIFDDFVATIQKLWLAIQLEVGFPEAYIRHFNLVVLIQMNCSSLGNEIRLVPG
ncbi:hypothetical protein ACS0TY_030383 [Phlomoides rotata]